MAATSKFASALGLDKFPASQDVLSLRVPIWRFRLLLILAAAALLFLRCPSSLLHPHFYAEDGHVWFAESYNFGPLASLFRTYNGYFQTSARLAAVIASFFAPSLTPLIFNVIGLGVQLLPVAILLSNRTQNWGPFSFRSLLALMYIALPNAGELHAQITESQWPLALSAFLLLLADPPRSRRGKAFDVLVIGLSGLSGPFCFLLLAIVAIFYSCRRHLFRWLPAALLLLSSLIQASGLLLTDAAARSHVSVLGASLHLFVRILAGQVYLSTLLGGAPFALYWSPQALLAVAIVVSLFIGLSCWKGPLELRLFILFAALVFIASLRSPVTAPGRAWMHLALAFNMHYWFYPALALTWCIVWSLTGPGSTRWTKCCAIPLASALLFGIAHDWNIFPVSGFDDATSLRRLAFANPGSSFIFPIAPEGWVVHLTVKKNGH